MCKADKLIIVGAYGHSNGGAWMDVMADKHVGQSPEGMVACREMLEHFLSAR